MQPAILHIIYFSIPASIILLTLLHTKLELVIGPVDTEGDGIYFKLKKNRGKKRAFPCERLWDIHFSSLAACSVQSIFISQPA